MSLLDFDEKYIKNPDLLKNKLFVLEAVKYNGILLQYVSDELKKDMQVIYEAVKQNIHALKLAMYMNIECIFLNAINA